MMNLNQHLTKQIEMTECHCAMKVNDEWHDACYNCGKWHCDVPVDYNNLYIFDYTDDYEEDEDGFPIDDFDEPAPPYSEWQPIHEWIKTQYPEPKWIPDETAWMSFQAVLAKYLS